MSDDDSSERRLPEFDWTVVLVVLLIIGVAGTTFAVTTNWTATQDARLVADSGMTVVFGQTSINIQSGSPFTANNEITLNNTRFRSDAATSARVETLNTGGWTNISQTSVSSGLFVVNRSDTRPVGIRETADAMSVRSLDLSNTSGQVEVVATAGGSWTLTINNTGLAQGTGVVVVNQDTGKALDSASVDSNGNVELDQLSSVTNAKLNVKKGPAELKVYRESDPTKLVDNTQLRVRIFGQDSDTVIERTVTNGRMDLTGIPSDEPLTITVNEDNSDYAYRRTIITSVEEQSEVYLLNTTANPNTANVIFELDDRTGNYPASSTQLYIEKAITKDFNGDGTKTTQYQKIAGDLFGGTGDFNTVLEADERYRLRIQNSNGNERVLGSYTATLDDRTTLQIGQVGISGDGDKGYAADLRTFTSDSDNDGFEEQFVRVVYEDRDDRTESLSYTVRNRTNGTIVTEQTLTGMFGKHVATYQVAENETDASYRLTWNATRQQPDGTDKQISGTKYAGDVPGIGDDLPIDDRWLSLIAYVSIVAIAGLVVIVEPALGGIVATGWASVLTILGFIAVPAAALGLAAAISVVALIGRTST